MPARANIKSFAELGERIKAAVSQTIDITAESAYEVAERQAPIRKIFKGQRKPGQRKLTRRELSEELDIRRVLGLPTTGTIFTAKEKRNVVKPSNPYLRGQSRRPREPSADESTGYRPFREVNTETRELVRSSPSFQVGGRGPYEVKHGADIVTRRDKKGRSYRVLENGQPVARGDVKFGRRTEIGGRLKRSIYVGRQVLESGKYTQHVHSPVYYSRYVEFGTRHAGAQPYMRPALAAVRETYRSLMVQNIRRGIHRRIVEDIIPAGAVPVVGGTEGIRSVDFGESHPVLIPKE